MNMLVIPEFTLAKLEVCHVDAILGLQQLVIASLPEDKKTYIVEKTAEQIFDNLSSPNHAVGFFNEVGALIGSAFLLDCSPQTAFKGLTPCPTVTDLMEGIAQGGVIATVMVHKPYREHKLMERMVEALLNEAKDRNYQILVAEVVPNNIASHKGFTHFKFDIAGQDVDPADGTQLEFLKLDLIPPTRKDVNSCHVLANAGVIINACG